MRRVLLGCAVLAGCGRIGFAPRGGVGGDDGVDADLGPPPGFVAGEHHYVKASNTGTFDYFGHDVAIAADGMTFAVTASQESSSAAGVNGAQNNDLAPNSGAVYVFVRAGGVWMQQAYIKASNPDTDDMFGTSIAMSSDGNTLAVGAYDEASTAVGIDGNQASNTAMAAGAVYVFTRMGATWTQQAYVKASNTDARDEFGAAVALSSDGNTLAVGAPYEQSLATGIDGNQADNSGMACGAAYVLVRSGATWSQQAYVKASNTSGTADHFGTDVALASDGSTLVVGAPAENTTATGSGAAYVYTRTSATWSHQAMLKSTYPGAGDGFGTRVAMAGDGGTIVVGALDEWSNAIGIDGDQTNRTMRFAGAAYAFTRAGSTWTQTTYIKASNTQSNDFFADTLAMSPDGHWLAIGAGGESSKADGIGGDQTDNSLQNAGAVYVFEQIGATWAQVAYVKALNAYQHADFAPAALSANASVLVVGAQQEAGGGVGVDADPQATAINYSGAAYVYE